jgi:hypothetical protein
MVLAGRHSKVGYPLYAKLVPNSSEIVGLIELDLVGDSACAKLLVGSVLQVPSSLVLLYKLAHYVPVFTILALLGYDPPHF